jgi:DNA-directed RNA polymerase subunit RPC12/RpoP
MRSKRFLCSSARSTCCGHAALLVRSRAGGFVSRNCLKCGKPDYVSVGQLPELSCDFCNSTLQIRKLDGVNYHYVCDSCGRRWQLASVLPDWSELFEYSGLAAHGDGAL